MFCLQGKYGTATVYTNTIDDTAQSQIINMLNHPAFENGNMRIMPDVHAGKGSVIGFTAKITDKVIPNVVGVDISCGMITVNLGKVLIDHQALDHFIRTSIPHGFNVNSPDKASIIEKEMNPELLAGIKRISEKTNSDYTRHVASISSLGSGNHFIEQAVSTDNSRYLVIHSGSRNFGLQIAKYHQQKAEKELKGHLAEIKKEKEDTVKKLKSAGKLDKIQQSITAYDHQIKASSAYKDLSYLTGDSAAEYLDDMKVAVNFAYYNRLLMANKILEFLKIEPIDSWTTVHNYIDGNGIIRKGAVSAQLGERLTIPINMRDGSIIAKGKGNSDWNYSAPHGAGRLMSRGQAKGNIDLATFQESMKEVYSTSVKASTLDEAPMAYKSIRDILDHVEPTIQILEIIKPEYNFKA